MCSFFKNLPYILRRKKTFPQSFRLAPLSPPESHSFWEEDSFNDFAKGNYCPVNIGDILDTRYQVVGKLGFGSYSTVWLAHDIKCVCLCYGNPLIHETKFKKGPGLCRFEAVNPRRGRLRRGPNLEEDRANRPLGSPRQVSAVSNAKLRTSTIRRQSCLPCAKANVGQLARHDC